MSPGVPHRSQRPRELRRRVVLPARVRLESGWSDACILNVSSRGMLIRANRPVSKGSTIELWRGENLIVARVVWRQGLRAGLCAEQCIPVDDIVTLDQAPALQLTATSRSDRRKRPRSHEDSRLRARAIEFGSMVVIAASLAATLFSAIEQALARPLAVVSAALGG